MDREYQNTQGRRSGLKLAAARLLTLFGWILVAWAAMAAVVAIAQIFSGEFQPEALFSWAILVAIPVLWSWRLIKRARRIKESMASPETDLLEMARPRPRSRTYDERPASRPTEVSDWAAKDDHEPPVIQKAEQPRPQAPKRPLSSREMVERAKKRTRKS